jgi:hypothetical protein
MNKHVCKKADSRPGLANAKIKSYTIIDKKSLEETKNFQTKARMLLGYLCLPNFEESIKSALFPLTKVTFFGARLIGCLC